MQIHAKIAQKSLLLLKNFGKILFTFGLLACSIAGSVIAQTSAKDVYVPVSNRVPLKIDEFEGIDAEASLKFSSYFSNEEYLSIENGTVSQGKPVDTSDQEILNTFSDILEDEENSTDPNAIKEEDEEISPF